MGYLGGYRPRDAEEHFTVALRMPSGVSDLTKEQHRWFERVVELDLGSRWVTDREFRTLQSFNRLEKLSIAGELSDEAMSVLAGMRKLKWLSIDSLRLTGLGFIHLTELPALAELDISRTKIGGDGFTHIGQMQALRSLTLPYGKVSDTDVRQLVSLKALEILQLDDSPITDAGVKFIVQMRGLRYLRLPGTLISDKGLLQLSQLRALRLLHLDGVRVSDYAVARLKQSLPELTVLGK